MNKKNESRNTAQSLPQNSRYAQRQSEVLNPPHLLMRSSSSAPWRIRTERPGFILTNPNRSSHTFVHPLGLGGQSLSTQHLTSSTPHPTSAPLSLGQVQASPEKGAKNGAAGDPVGCGKLERGLKHIGPGP